MQVSYYPGCSLEETAKPYDMSTRQVCRALELDLLALSDWSCCGSSPALKTSGLLSLSLGAHNLALAETQSPNDLLIPCPFCFRRLLSAREELAADEKLSREVQDIVGSQVTGRVQVHSLLGYLHQVVGLDAIRARVRRPLRGLKVVTYYGCYLVKPPQVTHYDDPENPVSMDELLTALGAEVLPWDFKTECCGASLAVSKTDRVVELCARLVGEAGHRGADAIVVACQLCQANLDTRQAQIRRRSKGGRPLPVVYFTQLMGWAFGSDEKELGLDRHLVGAEALFSNRRWMA